MKKLLTLTLLLIAVNGYSQKSPLKGFLKPVDQSMFEMDITTDRDITSDYVPSKWLFRPVFNITAMRFDLRDPVEVTSLNSFGTGISYQRFVLHDAEPYMNFGVNLIILFSEAIGEVEPVKLSFAGTVTLWQHISAGFGYSVAGKNMFLLTGVVFSFNGL